jgi:hypothetical protein
MIFYLTARRTQTIADFLIARPARLIRYVIPLARDKKLIYAWLKANTQSLKTNVENPNRSLIARSIYTRT